jgi:hypothetical protein
MRYSPDTKGLVALLAGMMMAGTGAALGGAADPKVGLLVSGAGACLCLVGAWRLIRHSG